ncbi:hypothetical protein [Flavobacterium microcysteis]|uniref:Uncharacterized protein n=1 Tax=Flavobacterium microcysteis TaxID=2596891 RepID=A0A501QLW8_9FLAO|nr:hypothetical protein [Flavobacterium microcysteis]TPD73750.1 hypothetical protein FJA49_00200 [Flavobacterium microcysteis]
MYLTPEQSKNLIKVFFESVENDYLEKFNFLTKLLQDDDWSFVIKSHSLIESLVTELIVNKIDTDLKKVVERMPLHGEISKISIAKTYNLIPSEQIKFLIKLSEIRNNIVHKYENINFTFETYLSTLDKNQIKNWKEMLLWEGMETPVKEILKTKIDKSPKEAVWIVLTKFVNHAIVETNLLKGSKIIQNEADKTTVELLKGLNIQATDDFDNL